MTLRFGTDGVRGIANSELTVELVAALGRAAVRVLGNDEPFVVGRDTRRSGPMLEAALVSGICAEGADVLLAGVLPTPAIAYLAQQHDAPAAVISASHNTYEDNGVKLFAAGGRKLSDTLEAHVERELVELAHAMPPAGPSGAGVGVVAESYDAYDEYVARLVGAAVPEQPGQPLVALEADRVPELDRLLALLGEGHRHGGRAARLHVRLAGAVARLAPQALLLGPGLVEEDLAHLGVTEAVERRLVAGLAQLRADVLVGRRRGQLDAGPAAAADTGGEPEGQDGQDEDGNGQESGECASASSSSHAKSSVGRREPRHRRYPTATAKRASMSRMHYACQGLAEGKCDSSARRSRDRTPSKRPPSIVQVG